MRKTTLMAFRSDEAVRLTGLSKWQLSNWKDMVGPSWPSGAYGFRDLVALRTLATLKDKHGVPTVGLRRASRFLTRHAERPWSEMKIGVGPKSKLYFFEKRHGKWVSAEGSGQSVAEVTLDHIAAETQKAVKSARERPRSLWGKTEKTSGVCGNQERFAGTRVAVDLVVDLISAGANKGKIREEFPTLQAPDIEYAQKLAANS